VLGDSSTGGVRARRPRKGRRSGPRSCRRGSPTRRPSRGRGGTTRRRVAIVKELMRKWDLRKCPLLLLDFGCSAKSSGEGAARVVIGMEHEGWRVRLPRSPPSRQGTGATGGGRASIRPGRVRVPPPGLLGGEPRHLAVDVAVEKNLGARGVEHFREPMPAAGAGKGAIARPAPK